MENERADGRREAGERTRARLMAAARTLLAERGEENVSLRDITDAAGANVAAVSYHFGSKDALCRAAIQDALDGLTRDQLAGLQPLIDGPDLPTLEGIVAAWIQPIVCGVTGAREANLVMRLVARSLVPPPTCQEEAGRWPSRSGAIPALVTALQRIFVYENEDELRFRVGCAEGILHFIASGNMPNDLLLDRPDAVERALVPMLCAILRPDGGGVRR